MSDREEGGGQGNFENIFICPLIQRLTYCPPPLVPGTFPSILELL